MSLTDNCEQLIDALSWELEDLVAERQALKVREAGLGDSFIYNNSMAIRVAPDTRLAGYPAAGYPANLFCRISGIRPDIRLNS